MSVLRLYVSVIILFSVLVDNHTLKNDDSRSDLLLLRNKTDTVIDDVDLNRNEATTPQRKKRSIFNLYFMFGCGSDCNPINYLNYGCYCGLDGSGIPVDGIDRCCQQHDRCYADANCPWGVFLYFTHYDWTCYNGRGYCGYKGEDSCSRRLCECDYALIECLRDYPCPRRKLSCGNSWYW